MTTQDLKNNRNIIINRLNENNRVLKSAMQKIADSISEWKDVDPTEENILAMVDAIAPNPFKKATKKELKKVAQREAVRRMPKMTERQIQEINEQSKMNQAKAAGLI